MSATRKGVCLSSMGLLLAALAASCGPYSFSGTSLPSSIKTVAVPIFEDETAEFGLKEKLTDAVIDRITQDNTLSIADRRRADSVIEGTILRVEDRAGAYNREEQVQGSQVFVTVQMRFEDLHNNKVIWEDRISQWGNFDPAGGEEARQVGIDEALKKIADEVLNRTVTSW